PHDASERKRSPPSMTSSELLDRMDKPDLEEKEQRILSVEYQRRWSLPLACLIFGLIGVALGTSTNKRIAKSSGFVLCLIVIIVYWVLYVVAEGASRNGTLPAWL